MDGNSTLVKVDMAGTIKEVLAQLTKDLKIPNAADWKLFAHYGMDKNPKNRFNGGKRPNPPLNKPTG